MPQLAARVRTSDLAREVDARLRLDLGADAVLGKIRSDAVVQSAQIAIEVDDVDPDRAQRIALETARVFEEQHAARNQGVPSQDRAIVSILDRASPARLVWPRQSLIVGAAAIVGAIAGLALAIGVHYVDDTLKTAAQVEAALGLMTLGRIPR
ncbi:MAG: hypothetical protein U0821_04950 [Chloroflexota bacterium]